MGIIEGSDEKIEDEIRNEKNVQKYVPEITAILKYHSTGSLSAISCATKNLILKKEVDFEKTKFLRESVDEKELFDLLQKCGLKITEKSVCFDDSMQVNEQNLIYAKFVQKISDIMLRAKAHEDEILKSEKNVLNDRQYITNIKEDNDSNAIKEKDKEKEEEEEEEEGESIKYVTVGSLKRKKYDKSYEFQDDVSVLNMKCQICRKMPLTVVEHKKFRCNSLYCLGCIERYKKESKHKYRCVGCKSKWDISDKSKEVCINVPLNDIIEKLTIKCLKCNELLEFKNINIHTLNCKARKAAIIKGKRDYLNSLESAAHRYTLIGVIDIIRPKDIQQGFHIYKNRMLHVKQAEGENMMTVLGNYKMEKKKAYLFRVSIKYPITSNFVIGIARKDHPSTTIIGYHSKSWGVNLRTRDKIHDSSTPDFSDVKGWKENPKNVFVFVDLIKGHLKFLLNFEDPKKNIMHAFQNVWGDVLYPAVSCSNNVVEFVDFHSTD